jgi:hypothetical protein
LDHDLTVSGQSNGGLATAKKDFLTGIEDDPLTIDDQIDGVAIKGKRLVAGLCDQPDDDGCACASREADQDLTSDLRRPERDGRARRLSLALTAGRGNPKIAIGPYCRETRESSLSRFVPQSRSQVGLCRPCVAASSCFMKSSFHVTKCHVSRARSFVDRFY